MNSHAKANPKSDDQPERREALEDAAVEAEADGEPDRRR